MKTKLEIMVQTEQMAGRTPVRIELSSDDEGELWTEQSDPGTTSLGPAAAERISTDGLRSHVSMFIGLPISYGHPQTRIACKEDAA
jgi:hypothetical protein